MDDNWDNPCFECPYEIKGDCPDDCPVLEIMLSHCAEHGDFEGTTCQGCVNPTIH